jgi:hypothetical protein
VSKEHDINKTTIKVAILPYSDKEETFSTPDDFSRLFSARIIVSWGCLSGAGCGHGTGITYGTPYWYFE